MENVIHQNRVRQFFFIAVILLLGLLLVKELMVFLPALLGAITLYILMHRWMFWLTEKRKWGKGWAALVLMLFSFIVILLPVGLLQTWASVDQGYWYARSSEFMNTPVMQTLRWLRVPGDTLFALGAVALVIFVAGVRRPAVSSTT